MPTAAQQLCLNVGRQPSCSIICVDSPSRSASIVPHASRRLSCRLLVPSSLTGAPGGSRERLDLAIYRARGLKPSLGMAELCGQNGRVPKQSPKTAAEVLAELNADPAWRAAMERKDAASRDREAARRLAEAPLVADLRQVGINVESAWLLYEVAPYPTAIPVLLEHFERPYDPATREGIARALAVPEASWAWERLLSLLFHEPDQQERDVRFALALAVVAAAPKGSTSRMLELIRDTSLGASRLAFVGPLMRSKDPRALETLEQLRDDPDLTKEVQFRLGQREKRLQRRARGPRPPSR